MALVALFNATDGPNWRTTWDIENDPYDTWFGVNVNVDGCVTGLDLINNDLTGELPPELGDLTEMVSFNVTMNNLTGSLPVELGSWAVIQDFFVGNNNLSGNLPESYSNFVNLRQIVLQDNSLSGLLPSSWSNFTNSPNFNGVLNLRNNLLEGCYPQSYLAFCDFGENVRFEGNIDLNGDFSTFCINGGNDPATENPSNQCDDITTSTDNPAGTNVFYPLPSWFDDCLSSGAPITGTLVEGFGNQASDIFPIGTTAVRWEFYASNGDTLDCSFNVTVDLDAGTSAFSEPIALSLIHI